jgi:NADH-quinone oxidoreductase subunit A
MESIRPLSEREREEVVEMGASSWGVAPSWFLGLALYGASVIGVVALVSVLCHWLGGKKPSLEKLRAYECGIVPTGSARLAYPVPFYLVAILFLLFDVEAIYVLCWAVVAKELGWAGWVLMVVFLTLLMISLAYAWRKGALDFRAAKGW